MKLLVQFPFFMLSSFTLGKQNVKNEHKGWPFVLASISMHDTFGNLLNDVLNVLSRLYLQHELGLLQVLQAVQENVENIIR